MENDKSQHELEFVKVDGSDVFFYCDVSQESIVELCQVMKKLERELFAALYTLGIYVTVPTITLHIQSDGGNLNAGLGCMDFLRRMKARIITIVEGVCASAATFLFLGGDERVVTQNSYLLIHQLSSEFWGNYEDMKDEMKFSDQLMKQMKKIYLRETSIPEVKLDRLMKRDLYLSYKKCVRYGLTLL
jgi:ATP-dependent protease ClpP protease subunit